MTHVCDHEPFPRPENLRRVELPDVDDNSELTVRTAWMRAHDAGEPHGQFVEITGELDACSATGIAPVLASQSLVGADIAVVIVGAKNLSFVDGAGLRALEAFRDSVIDRNGEFRLHDPGPMVRRLLSILDLDTFHICAPAWPMGTSTRRAGIGSARGRSALNGVTGPSCSVTIDHTRGGPRVEASSPRTAHEPIEGKSESLYDRLTIVVSTDERRRFAGSGSDMVRVAFRGTLDASVAFDVEHRTAELLDGVGHLVVDLGDVTLIDSAGVRLVEHLASRMRSSGGEFELAAWSAIVDRVFVAIGIDLDGWNDSAPTDSPGRSQMSTPTTPRRVHEWMAPGTRRAGQRPGVSA